MDFFAGHRLNTAVGRLIYAAREGVGKVRSKKDGRRKFPENRGADAMPRELGPLGKDAKNRSEIISFFSPLLCWFR